MRPLCSVVMVTYNRASLLYRSVECYNQLRFPPDRLEIIIVDDGSDDNGDTRDVANGLRSDFDTTYMRIRKPSGLWRDTAMNINRGIRAAKGSVILITHPEVMPGRDTVTACCDLASGFSYACAKPYFLSQPQQDAINTVGWTGEGPLAVRGLPGFYDPIEGGNPDFHPRAIEECKEWRSWVFGGHSRQTWRRLGGMIETAKWGTVDVIYSDRRKILGVIDRTAMGEQTYCVHQWHECPTRGDEAGWKEEGSKITMTREALQYPAIDNLW